MAVSRRDFLAATGSLALLPGSDERPGNFRFNYLVASCLYGYMYVGEIFPELAVCGSRHIDLWPKKHGNQREQLDGIGEARFVELLNAHEVSVGCITQYLLGPFGLTDEMRLAQRLGCRLIVTGDDGPKGLTGAALKTAVAAFVERLKPHLERAEDCGVTIAIENHSSKLFDSPDSLRYLHELAPSPNLAVALAPYHLPQDAELLAGLIRELGSRIAVFYAWQHGKGCMTKLPKDEELLQLPGRGPLDFAPIVAALASIGYAGWTEIFMHPVPRGIPILETAAEVSAEINRARAYLDGLALGADLR